MAERPARAVVALFCLLALTACSAGVPATGKVVGKRPVPPPPNGERLIGPGTGTGSGPRAGMGEVEVVRGFFAAMGMVEQGEISRWMVADPKARAAAAALLAPTADVGVYQDGSLLFRPPVASGNGEQVVSVSVRMLGTLHDSQDWIPDAATAHDFDVRLRQEHGEWRVADAPAELWVGALDLAQHFDRRDVYVVAGDGQHLAPVAAFVRSDDAAPGQELALRARQTLGRLLRKPSERLRGTLRTAIPDGTALRGFDYANGVATVDLSHGFLGRGGLGRLRAGQVVWTVTGLIASANVRILIDGRPGGTVGPDDFDISRSLNRTTPAALAQLGPLPHPVPPYPLFVRGGVVNALARGPGGQLAPQIASYVVPGPISAPTWSPDGRQVAFVVGGGDRQQLWVGSAPVPGGSARARRSALVGELSEPSWLPYPDPAGLLELRRAAGQVELWRVAAASGAATRLRLAALPGGYQPTLLRVSPDGAFALAVGARSGHFGDSGPLFLGLLSPSGVDAWLPSAVNLGLGDVSSPVWVDPTTIAFIARSGIKDELAKLYEAKADGWGPVAILDPGRSGDVAVDVGDQLTVDPAGEAFIFTVRSEASSTLWTVNAQRRTPSALTISQTGGDADTDPDYASR